MNKLHSKLFLAVMIVFGGLAIPFNNAHAIDVCYAWDVFPSERYRLNVKLHSLISEEAEQDKFGHAKQAAFSVHGKEVGGCGFGSMLATTGTVVVAQPTATTTGPTGAHMGLEVHISRGDGVFFGTDFCRSIEVDCTTSEVSAAPNTWSCQSRNEFDIYHGSSTLTKVNPTTDPLCSVFEDGAVDATAATVAPTGPASGLNK